MTEVKQAIQAVIKELFNLEQEVILTRPDEQFGDYATNVALQLGKQISRNPREVANAIAEMINATALVEATVAGPGFINLKLSDKTLIGLALKSPQQELAGQKIVAEYSDPNPFKVLHAGHLYTSVVGDAIANLLEQAGGEVHRVNFGGDVGLHVGRTMHVILQRLGGENPDKLAEIPAEQRSEWMASAYVEGTNLYEQDEAAKAEMIALNKRVYQLHAEADRRYR